MYPARRMKTRFFVVLVCCVISVIPVRIFASDPSAEASYRYAAGLFDMGEYELSIQEFSSFLSSYPTDSLAASAAFWLGESYFNIGNHAAAAEAFSRAVRPGADYSLQEDARLRKAEALWEAGDHAGAAVAYEALLEAHPRGKYRARGSYWLGRCYIDLGRKESAARVFKNAAAWGDDEENRAESAYLAGDILRELDRCSEAGEQFRDVLRLQPLGDHAPGALEGLARCALDDEDLEGAVTHLKQLVDGFPQAKEASLARFHLAESLSSLGRHTEAMAAYRAVLRDPEARDLWDDAVYGEAWSAAAGGDTVAALASYEQLSNEFSSSPLAAEAKFREAQLAYVAGEYPRAERTFSSLIGDWPTSPFVSAAIYWRGWCLQKRDERIKAERDFLNYQSLYPDSQYAAQALFMAGLSANERGSNKQAIETLERLRTTYPQSDHIPQALATLANLYADAGQEDNAYAIRSQLALEHPETKEAAMAMMQSGFSSLEKGDETAALVRFKAVLERPDIDSTERASAAYYIAEAHYRLGDYEEAEHAYEDAQEMNRGSDLEDDALYGRAWSALRAKSPERAGSLFAELASSFPESPFADEAIYRQGQALYDQELFEEAATAYGTLLRHHGGSEYADDALYAQAWSQLKIENIEDAASLFRRLIELYPGSELIPDALYDLGSCYTRLNRVSATARTLYQLLTDYPAYPKAQNAKAALVEAYDAMGKTSARDSLVATLRSEDDKAVAATTLLNIAAKRVEQDDGSAQGILIQIIDQYPDSPEAVDARLQSAWLYFRNGNMAEAYAMVEPLCTTEDADIAGRACMRAAESKFELGEFGDAATRYRMALDSGSSQIDHAAAWYGLAWCAMETGENDQAVEAFYELYRNHTDSPLWTDGTYRLGQLLMEEGRTEDAAAVYAVLGDRDGEGEKGLEAMYRRGMILKDRKSYAQAAALFRKVATSAEDRLGELASFQLGHSLHAQNRLTDAAAVFVGLADTYPESDLVQQSLYSAGVCKASTKRWKTAAEYFARAAAASGELKAEALLQQGWAHVKAGEHETGATIFNRLLREYPDHMKGAEVSFRLAQSLSEMGDHAAVDSICGELIYRNDWAYPDRALYLQGVAKKGLGQVAEAMDIFQTLLDTYPNSDLARYARAQYDALAGGNDQ